MDKKFETLFAEHGQAIWYDNMRRGMLEDGSMQALFDAGVRGVTSNPSIFEKAIGQSGEYDSDIAPLVAKNHTTNEIYEALVLADIRQTADLLLPLYEKSVGQDGYVSLEVNPKLADDTAGTVAEAKRFFEILDRPNVMIKIPATAAGLTAISEVIAAGINVNVTLIFSQSNYKDVVNAYMTGLEKRLELGGNISKVASVASFFISRIDKAVDAQLDALEEARATELRGHIAIDNARLAYQAHLEMCSSDRWQQLAKQGAQVQRPLWASTSTKDPSYPDTLYVDSLIGNDTVNTVPEATLAAFADHGTLASTITQDIAASKARMETLQELGIDLDEITQKLQDDGVAAFAKSFDTLMESIAEKQKNLT